MSLSSIQHLLSIPSEIFSMNPIKVIKWHTVIQSLLNIFYFFKIFALMACVIFCIVYGQMYGAIYDAKGVIGIALQFFYYNCRIFIPVLCLIIPNFHKKPMNLYLDGFNHIDTEFRRMGHKINYAGTRKMIYGLFGFITFKLILTQASYSFNEGVVLNDYIIYNVPLFLIYIMNMQWIINLQILSENINSLTEMIKSLKCHQCWVIKDYLEKSKCGFQKNYSKAEILRISGRIYDKLCTQADLLTDAYAWQILVLVPSLFISIIKNTFYLCLMVNGSKPFDAVGSVFNVMYFASFLEIVLPCVFIKEDVDKFKRALHKLDRKFGGVDEVRDVMNKLTLQTYHQTIQFSIFGFFPLDGTLIYSISGALTTYLIILLQFEK